ncbi:fasciclin-like arabinogalactan protein 6 [Zingiber officinale]|uniref:fasciclin-like arabinogalactan protein 6 n=1 Tax=Zingiber officinale TaxID=94328 RepID=UPI001C4D01F4|nr:fasciclin-like arabinogalactan protein 6 [Zingiber officinale]
MAAATLLTFSFLVTLLLPAARSQPTVPPAPAPAGPLNLTAILAKGGQFTSFIRLLQQTRVDEQINSQLNNSFNGLTVFAPTDNAFAALPAGTFNSLSQQQQIQLVLFHVLPRYYSFSTFQTASNPLPTQASGESGVFTLNVTTPSAANSNQANVSTGVVETPIETPLYANVPLVVYPVQRVLLPYAIFGPHPPAPAPSARKSPSSAGASGAAAPEDHTSGATRITGIGRSFVAGALLLAISTLL